MSKPWFLEMTMEAEPTPLAGLISKVMNTSPSLEDVKLSNGIQEITIGANGIDAGR